MASLYVSYSSCIDAGKRWAVSRLCTLRSHIIWSRRALYKKTNVVVPIATLLQSCIHGTQCTAVPVCFLQKRLCEARSLAAETNSVIIGFVITTRNENLLLTTVRCLTIDFMSKIYCNTYIVSWWANLDLHQPPLTRMVCSNCAERFPSAVTDVQLSGHVRS